MGWSEKLIQPRRQQPGRFWPALALLAVLLLVLGLAVLLRQGEGGSSLPGHAERSPGAEGNPPWLS